MSIWGRRVDAWFDDKTGGNRTSRAAYNRAGLNAAWQVALVVLAAFVGLYLLGLSR